MTHKISALLAIAGCLLVSPLTYSMERVFPVGDSKIRLKIGNIIDQGSANSKTAAIVNAANETLIGSAGVAAVIQDAAGSELIRYIHGFKSLGKSSRWAGDVRCNVGAACCTPAFDLAQKGIGTIIHAVGPDSRDSEQEKNKEALLRSAYRTSLELTISSDIRLISFPALSTGVFGYNIDEATPIAIDEVIRFLKKYPHYEVRFVVTPQNFPIYERELQKQ
jgi:O-acetyl-ADP-ribose deacetylase (regulator of RNase III)